MDEWISTWSITTTTTGRDISVVHIHNLCEFLYLQQGSAQMRIGNTDYTLKANQLAIIGRMEMHDLTPRQLPFSRIGFHVNPDALVQLGIPLQLSSALTHHPQGWCHCFDLQDQPQVRALIKTLAEEIDQNRTARQEMLGILFHQLLLHLYRLTPERFSSVIRDEEMEQIKQYIEEHFADFSSIKELASSNYLTESHFIMRFKKYTGHTPYHYRTLCRMAQARRMLLQKDLSLSEIAYLCGFSDLNGFVRSFHKNMHITPGKFREMSHYGNVEQ